MEAFEILQYSLGEDVLPLLFIDIAAGTCVNNNRLFSPLSKSQSRQHVLLCSLDKQHK